MCGRFVSTVPPSGLEALFSAQSCGESLNPSYNVAPSMEIYGVIGAPGSVSRELKVFRWGFGQRSEKKGQSPNFLINARIETVDSKPRFAASFKHRRCLVPADGFYEWNRGFKRKGRQPSYIYKPDHKPLAMAGIWEFNSREGESETRPSLVILTRQADGCMSDIHDRMPVTLPSSLWARWLDSNSDNAVALKRFIAEGPTETFQAHHVDARIGNPRHDEPENIAAVQPNTLW